MLVRCTCFCETHVQLFEHLSIWSYLVFYIGYICLLDVPDEIGEKIESSWPE